MRTGILCGIIILLFVGPFAHAGNGDVSNDGKITAPVHAENHSQKCFTNTIGQTFLYIKPGSFLMGSPQEESVRCST
jgi:formylglycine-generating enzyme required for sulfatase activity